jgi:hypothetical protein
MADDRDQETEDYLKNLDRTTASNYVMKGMDIRPGKMMDVKDHPDTYIPTFPSYVKPFGSNKDTNTK